MAEAREETLVVAGLVGAARAATPLAVELMDAAATEVARVVAKVWARLVVEALVVEAREEVGQSRAEPRLPAPPLLKCARWS